MNPEVVELRVLAGNAPLKAFVSIRLGEWVIHDWRIVQKDGQRAWISVPQVSWKDKDGQVRYRALLSIPGEQKQQIEIAILSAWEKEKKNGNHST
ncbi:MAG: SpoVG family protein [Proteobacteria bacterium]|nr:SpoVG family protein [Pseudomonadota bacterium]